MLKTSQLPDLASHTGPRGEPVPVELPAEQGALLDIAGSFGDDACPRVTPPRSAI